MPNRNAFERYLQALRRKPLDEKTEHTDRSALEMLLQEFANQAGKGIAVQHEPKREADKGAPDFKVTQRGLIIGYVENKGIDENLNKVLKSEQIAKYKSLSNNIILTDYLDFIWINKHGTQRERLCHATDLENRKFQLREDRIEAVGKLLSGFFSSAPDGIGDSQKLALALAARSRLLRDYLGEELVRQERDKKGERLYGLYQIFRDQVFHELELKEFADALAQMLAYGLFLARLNADTRQVTLHNAREYVPGSFRLIRELVDFLTELEKPEYRDVRWVVEEVLSIINNLDLTAIHESLSFRGRRAISRKVRAGDEEEHRLFERDPFIYFYEDYLRAYDKETSKSRGVYYTPPPIVNFIVRAVDDILKESFGIADGLADHKRVTVLDFACGTGTFLLEVFQRAFENIGGPDSGRADLIVREHFLKNIFGFEYLIAPYTIAHLKLSQFLKDKGHSLKDGERLQVFLTNTLEPIEPIENFLLPAVTAEVKAAQAVKETPILVITGNPPYSGHSKNKGPWITAAIDEYKFTWEKTADGLDVKKPLGEKNPKWLQDDYVKFIRFAQMKMDGFTYTTKGTDGKLVEHSVPGVENGIVGIITNHSWLDNPTFRGMRQSLMRSFQQIFVLDLHGSTMKGEVSSSEDENVFDIRQGVAISLFVKRPGLSRCVWRGDIHGRRLTKYKLLANSRTHELVQTKIVPLSDLYMFVSSDQELREEYAAHWRITKILSTNVLGFQTHRDHFAIAFDRSEILSRISALADTHFTDQQILERYDLRDNRDWKLAIAREAVRKQPFPNKKIIQCDYRPFDRRWCYFGYETMDYPRRELLTHVAWHENLCLQVCRQVRSSAWRHVLISAHVAESCLVSLQSREGNYSFPLWLYDDSGNRSENLTVEFRDFTEKRYDHHYSPEEILGYIYAVLHAPTYRTRYAEFLRIDFPRIPFPEKASDFETLSKLGWALVEAHLLRTLKRLGLAKYHGKGDHTVEAVRYAPNEKAVWINKTQCFKPVPEDVWNFHIGGYQVLDKYLKSRKGRKLSLDEINHVAAVADALAFTIEQMQAIDKAYRAAFGERG